MADVSVTFGAQDNGLQTTIHKINGDIERMKDVTAKTEQQFGSSFSGMVKAGAALAVGIGAVKLAFAGVKEFASNFGAALDMGGELNDLSARTGETAGNLMVLQRAFLNAGSSADAVGPAMNKLQKFMFEAGEAGSDQAAVIGELGISLDSLKGKTPTEQMEIFAQKITAINDPTSRAAAAMKIFGKSGGELLPVLQSFSGELDTARGQLGGLPGVMDRSAAIFDTVSDNLTNMKGKLVEVAAGFLEKAAPALAYFTDQLAGIDGAGWGGKMMDTVIQVSEMMMGVFKNPLGAIQALGFELLAIGAKFMNSMASVFGYVVELGKKSFGLVAFEVTDMLVDAFKNAWEVFTLSGQRAIETLRNLFAAGINALWDVAASKGAVSFGEAFDKFKTAGVAANQEVITDLDNRIKDATQTYSDGMDYGTDRISKKWEDIKSSTSMVSNDVFMASDASKLASEKWQEVADSGKSMRESMGKTLDSVAVIPKHGKDMREHVEFGAAALEKAASKVKESLTASEQIMKNIAAAEGKDKVDKQGRNEKKAADAIARGDFDAARRAAGKVQRGEEDKIIGDAFNAGNKFQKSTRDMAKEQGIETFGKSNKDLREELLAKAQKEKANGGGVENSAADSGKHGGGGKDQPKADPIIAIVTAIKGILEKIEPKLPTHALGI